MNSSPIQGYMTVALTVISFLISILLGMGCSEIAGTISCAASTAPTWLVPYLGYAALFLGFAKTALGLIDGKLFANTAVISNSGAPGTVTQKSVDMSGH
ncbi:MAG: hypothetical protein ABJA10_07765 [Aestuariivirga sp.]